MNVYIVSNGQYSDYSVLAIFADKDKAEYYKQLTDSDNEVEEFELHDDSISMTEEFDYIMETKSKFSMNPNENKVEFLITSKTIKQICGDIWFDYVLKKVQKNKITLSTTRDGNYNLRISKEFHGRYTQASEEKMKKITYDTVAEIKQMLVDGMTVRDIEQILNG